MNTVLWCDVVQCVCTQGPAVLFASPGMMTGGVSLEAFRAWAPEPRNLVVMPSYQVGGVVHAAAGQLVGARSSCLQVFRKHSRSYLAPACCCLYPGGTEAEDACRSYYRTTVGSV